MQERWIFGPVVATMLVAAAGILAAPQAPAAASTAASAVAACSGATGVTVVVDYNEIGGPTRAGCDRDGAGDSAAQVFTDAGFTLEYEPRQPGYVCKVTGLPTDRPCLENDSFWSLWWSDGKSGRWVFSTEGVSGLSVPDGGYVSFAWHEGAGRAQPPDVVPTAHEEQDPTQETTDTNGGEDGNGDQDDDATSDAATTVTTESTATTAPASESTSGAGMPDDTDKSGNADATDPTSDSSESTVPGAAEITAGPPSGDLGTETDDDDGGALPTWIGLGLAVLVLGAAGVVTVVRRRSG